MVLRQLDLTTALRPSLLPEEILLFVQDGVGLYRDKYKIEGHQNGNAYLTSHRICYVDNEEPRQHSVAIDLKDVDRPELYTGFLKSSPKITIYPKPPKRQSLAVRPSASQYSSAVYNSTTSSPTRSGFSPVNASPVPPQREINATWICPICSFSNPVPPSFDPSTANANTPIPACQACGIKPPLIHVTKAAIAAIANRPASTTLNSVSNPTAGLAPSGQSPSSMGRLSAGAGYIECPRCTFRNHPSVLTCEICNASLSPIRDPRLSPLAQTPPRSESPAPLTSITSPTTDPALEVIKISFRTGGEKTFYDRLKDALIQRKWLLSSAPPVPKPMDRHAPSPIPDASSPSTRRIGIAGLERRDIAIRKENEIVIGSAFEDLEALMTSAKEVIAMAERFAQSNPNQETSALLSESASALGLTTTRDMLSSGTEGEKTYVRQLSRDLAEYLTDDRHGILKREGGVMTLVDLWAVFNRRRNGIELVSPADFGAAAAMWEELKLPIRLRRFRSGVAVVQGRDRTDEKTVRAVLEWLTRLRESGPPPVEEEEEVEGQGVGYDWYAYGRGVTAQDTAERFGWSLGVAAEELEMAEERGALVREQDASGVRFWENHFLAMQVDMPRPVTPDGVREERDVREGLRSMGLI